MRFRTKLGGVAAAAAVLTLGLAGEASARWSFALDTEVNIAVDDVSICAGSPGSIVFRATSTYEKSALPATSAIGSTVNTVESVFVNFALTTKIVDVNITQVIIGDNGGTKWNLTGTGTAALPASYSSGSKVYVGDFAAPGFPKKPVELTVNNASYGCPAPPPPPPPMDSISVPVPPQIVDEKLTTISHPKSAPIAVSIPAGAYSTIQGSYDDAHPLQEDQPNERWYAVFYGADGAAVGTTSTTPDLALADKRRQWDGEPITLTANATSVVYFHAPGGVGPDSIYPDLLTLKPIGTYPPKPLVKPDPQPKPEPKVEPKPEPKPVTKDAPPAKTTTESAPVVVAVVAPVVPVPSAPSPATSSPPSSSAVSAVAAASSPASPAVEVKGIQVENAAPAVAAATPAAEVAFTGLETTLMASFSVALIGFGALMLLFARKRHAR
jgi:hypothetical protein